MTILPAVADHRNRSPQHQPQPPENEYDVPNQDVYINDDFEDDFEGDETLYETM